MNNPPAFPMTGFETRNGQGIQSVHHTGMTLRDYFAAQAMQAIAVGTLQASKANLKLLAENSYVIADAMMKAREA